MLIVFIFSWFYTTTLTVAGTQYSTFGHSTSVNSFPRLLIVLVMLLLRHLRSLWTRCVLCAVIQLHFFNTKLILPFFGKTMRMMPLQIEVMNSVKGIIKQIELWEVVA